MEEKETYYEIDARWTGEIKDAHVSWRINNQISCFKIRLGRQQ